LYTPKNYILDLIGKWHSIKNLFKTNVEKNIIK